MSRCLIGISEETILETVETAQRASVYLTVVGPLENEVHQARRRLDAIGRKAHKEATIREILNTLRIPRRTHMESLE